MNLSQAILGGRDMEKRKYFLICKFRAGAES